MRPETESGELSALARSLVAESSYLTLATADADCGAWATPVWFASSGLELFVWASKPGARHSRNIEHDGRVSLVIFNSSKPPGEGSTLYVTADATAATADAFDEALEVYNTGSLARGLSTWDAADLREPARHRLYRAAAREAWVVDEHDERIQVF